MRIFARRDAGSLDGPVATYAAVLDGDHLWWHVEGSERLVLHSADGLDDGPGIEVDSDPFPLVGLTAEVYDLLADGRPVVAGDLPDRRPARDPLGGDGRGQWAVRVDGGHASGRVRLVRRGVSATGVLVAVELVGDRIVLSVAPPPDLLTGGSPDSDGTALLLVDDHDTVVATLPADPGSAASDGVLRAGFDVQDLPRGLVGVLRVAVGTNGSWVRVRRSDTGLADPNAAVLLPELPDATHPERARARLRWSPDSLLALRLLDPTVTSQ